MVSIGQFYLRKPSAIQTLSIRFASNTPHKMTANLTKAQLDKIKKLCPENGTPNEIGYLPVGQEGELQFILRASDQNVTIIFVPAACHFPKNWPFSAKTPPEKEYFLVNMDNRHLQSGSADRLNELLGKANWKHWRAAPEVESDN